MTLTELYTARVEKLEQSVDSLKSEINTTQNNKITQEQDMQFWVNRIAEREAELKAAEEAIATTSTIAEIEAIASSMRAGRIDRRASQAKLNLSQRSLSVIEFKLDSLVNALNDTNNELSDAQQDLGEVTELDETHQKWIDSVALAPFNSMPDEADTLLTSSIEPALEKLKSVTSETFIDMLSKRLEHHWDELNDLETRSSELTLGNDTRFALLAGKGAEIETRMRTFESAVQGLSEFIANGQATLESGVATANRVQKSDLMNTVQKAHFNSLIAEGDIEVEVLTPESQLRTAEHELVLRIRELETARAEARAANPDIKDSDLDEVAKVKGILDGSDGKDSLATMLTTYEDASDAIGVSSFDTLIEKETLLKDAKDDLKVQTTEFLEDNPDLDPDTAAELDDAREAISDAEAELAVAQTEMRNTPWYKLEQLEVAVPSQTWMDALYLLNAQRKLTALKAVKPNELADAVSSANEDLATAIGEQFGAEDGISIAQDLIIQYQEKFKNITARGTEAAANVALGVL